MTDRSRLHQLAEGRTCKAGRVAAYLPVIRGLARFQSTADAVTLNRTSDVGKESLRLERSHAMPAYLTDLTETLRR
jgi:hypothetical protein